MPIEALDLKRGNVHRSRLPACKLADEPAGGGALGEAKMAVPEGKEDIPIMR